MLYPESMHSEFDSASLSSCLSAENSHANIASTCMMLKDLDLVSLEIDSPAEFMSKFPFHAHASLYWTDHLVQCGYGLWTVDLLKQMISFLDPAKCLS